MSWFRSADASMVWALEAARVCLVIFGCAAAGWAVGFRMGYRRGVREAMTADIINADHRLNGG
jgi:hypothetical protein